MRSESERGRGGVRPPGAAGRGGDRPPGTAGRGFPARREGGALPDAAFISEVRARIAAGLPVRRRLVGGGRLYVERPLPFLCVHRVASADDWSTSELVRPQASYLVAPADPALAGAIAALVAGVVEALAEACGACLVLELWSPPPPAEPPATLRITAPPDQRRATTVGVLADVLRAMTLPVGALPVEVRVGDVTPPGLPPLVPSDVAAHSGYLVLGLEVPPVYRSPATVYPAVLRAMARELTRALQQGFFEFARVQTPARPEYYQVLGRRRLLRAVREADRALVAIGASFDFLLDVTPVNASEAWDEFSASGRRRAPTLRYRMLAVDPALVKRALYALPLERLEDPVLALLLQGKRDELDRQLGLLADRDGPRFLPGSIALYGGVDGALFAEAEAILASVPAPPAPTGPSCDAAALAARARAEIAMYRARLPALGATVSIRDDIAALMVSHGDLLVPRGIALAAGRVDALLQHEVGTHIVTHANGHAQPLGVFAVGLAGYEALQEGLALLAEHLVGGLGAGRLRLIAARVIAVRQLIEGATLPEIVASLVEEYGVSPRAAFGVALRVLRGGGLTKDAIYLRGLLKLLDYLATDGALEPLLVGKVSLDQRHLVEELLRRRVLRPPALRPRWLDAPGAAARLARARSGLRPLDLVDPIDARETA